MKYTTLLFCVLGTGAILVSGLANASPDAKSKVIQSAISAAPPSIGRDATVMGTDATRHMMVLRKGTNGWTCMAAKDVMCVDANGLAWAQAWMTHKSPPADKVGLSYMLQGSTDASNTDAFAKKPASGKDWVRTGPHIMILNAKVAAQSGYPTGQANPDTSRPYVMFAGTPYAHIMMPAR